MFLFTIFTLLTLHVTLASSSIVTEDNCFLKYPLHKEFVYKFETQMTISKTENNAEQIGIHTGNHDLDMMLMVKIANQGHDDNGVYHFQLQIEDGAISNPDDWKRFGIDTSQKVDEEVLKQQFLLAMAKPFYYEQNCDMSIEHVYFQDDDEAFAINTKKSLINAFAASLKSTESSYSQREKDHLGLKSIQYAHETDADNKLIIKANHDEHRLLPIDHRALRKTHERIASKLNRVTTINNGVVERITESSGTRYPADDSSNPRGEEFAPQTNTGDHLVIMSSTSMVASLEQIVDVPQERRRKEPHHFDSLDDFLAAHHGAQVSFQRTKRHVLHDTRAPLSGPVAPSQGQARIFMDTTVQLLERYDLTERDLETGNRVNDPTSDLLNLWRDAVARFGDEHVVPLICRALRKTADCAREAGLINAALEPEELFYDSDLFDVEPVDKLDAVAEAAAYNALAMLGSDLAQQAVLARVADTFTSWQLRNRALMALPLFAQPLPQTITTVETLFRNQPANDDAIHVRKQALLTFGALIYNLEAGADAAVVQAELDAEAAAIVQAKKAQQAMKVHCEGLRRELHQLFMAAPEHVSPSSATLSVHVLAKALHNSLKDIAPHDWMDPATILRQRGVELATFMPEDEPDLHRAASSLDSAHVTAVEALAACHSDEACAALAGHADIEMQREAAKTAALYAAMARGKQRQRADEVNVARTAEDDARLLQERKRQVAPQDEGRVVDFNDPAVQGLATKPPNFKVWGTEEGRQNVQVSKVIKDFFQKHKCKPWGSCSAYNYRSRRPVGTPQEGNRRIWNNTIGSDKFFAYLEALMDFRGNPVSTEDLGASYDFFAGGLVSANIYDAEIPILQAYAAGGFMHRTRAGETGGNCTSFELELYFDYLLNAYYLKASHEKNCTRGIKSTCKANYPPEKDITFHAIDGVEFFKFDYRINSGWLNALFTIRGLGSVGFNLNWGFYISEEKGGLALNGLVEPLGKVDIEAKVTLPIVTYQGMEVLGIGIKGTLNLIQLSFPATGGLNAQTYRGCSALKVVTKALGGTITLRLNVFHIGAADAEIFRWRGAKFELPILETSCCKECEESCYNAFCNYRFGECECLIGFDGPGCDIECPPQCVWPAEPHPGVDCTPGGPRGASCRCNSGSYGWNCMSECPGGRLNPCSGHGVCDEEGLCTCDADYYGADCSATCPFVDGEICGAHGRCVFDGETAKCACFANAVGPKCELKCPESLDERKAPCSRRGDCWQDPIDSQPRCLCRLGFHGDRCEKLDANGSGRMLELMEPLDLGIQFTNNQTDANRLLELKPDGASMAAVWFQLTKLPTTTAALVEWRFGAIDITKSGDVRFCSGKDGDCYTSPLKAVADEWQFISATVHHHSGEVIVRHWSKNDLNAKKELKQALNTKPFPEVEMGSNVVRVGRRFVGKLDQLALMHLDSTSSRAQPTFSDADVLALRDEVIATHHTALKFYVLFDLGRGDHVFDQISLLRGELPDRCPVSENRAPSTCRKERFQFSDIRVKMATVSSSIAPPIKFNNQRQRGTYAVALDGRRILDAAMDVVVDSSGPPCTFKLFSGNTEVASTTSAVSGQASFELPLNTIGLTLLNDGDNALAWQGTSGCVLVESTLSVRVSAVDAAVEFGGSPYSYARLAHNKMGLSGNWQMEMWVRRDPLLLSQSGVLLGMVAPNYEPKERLTTDNSDFLLYETGGSDRGLRMDYRSGGRHLFENYATPINKWYHLAINVRNSGGMCTLGFFLDGVDLTRDKSGQNHPNRVMSCGDGALKGFGGNAFELRIGMAFGGEINDFLVWKDAQNGIRANMHLRKDIPSLAPRLLAAYTFDTTNSDDPTAVLDETDTQARGQLLNGAFRSLIYGVYHKWKLCPGISYFSTETVCSTRTFWEQGVCQRRPGVDNYACECNHGFFGSDCSGECPGGAGNICSNHGRCLILNTTQCVCDTGYVGPACEFECPGWSDPLNLPNQKVCFGFGTCHMKEDGKGAECLCSQEHDRYGPSCQYTYGEDPVASIDEDCEDCRGAHKKCVDGVCLCEEGYLLVVGVCKKSAAVALTHSVPLLIASLALLLLL